MGKIQQLPPVQPGSAVKRPRPVQGSYKTDLEIEAEKIAALERRKAGWSYREIGQDLSISHDTAHRRVLEALADIKQPHVDELRKLESERLDRMQAILEDRVAMGDEKALDLVLKISAQRARLLGLNAPEQREVTVTEVTQEDLALQEMIRSQRARVALSAGSEETAQEDFLPFELQP